MATTQSSPKSKGKGPQIAIPAKKPETAIIPVLKKGALSLDVGPTVIRRLAEVNADTDKANALLKGAEAKRYDALSSLTMAVMKAAKADNSIDLAVAFKSGPDANKAMSLLNDQLGIALGFREVVKVGTGDKARDKVVPAKSVAAFFPQAGEDKTTPAYRAKNTLRGNFLTMLKKCVQAACGIIENDITAKVDKTAGTLLLSGPAVQKQFGAASVLLNEKQSVAGKSGEEVKLKEKPSFTAIIAKAGEAHGKTVSRTSNTRGAAAQSLSNPGLALASACTALVDILARVKKPSAGQIDAVRKVESAIDTWLANND